MTAKVTPKDVERVADLAHLELTAAETEGMLHDLNAILDHVAQLNELDTAEVVPLSQVSELEGAGGASSLREEMPNRPEPEKPSGRDPGSSSRTVNNW